MKFRFLGGQDCPDWVLSQIAGVSNISAIKFKGLCQLAVEFIIEDGISDEDVYKYVNDNVDYSAVSRFLTCLRFIFRRAAGYNCAVEDLTAETTQLGLPPEHSTVLSRVYVARYDALKKYIYENIPRESRLEVCEVIPNGSNIEVIFKQEGLGTVCEMKRPAFQAFSKDMETAFEQMSSQFPIP